MAKAEMVSIGDVLDLQDARRHRWERFKVDYEPRSSAKWRIDRFEIAREDVSRLEIIVREGIERDPGWGTFTSLRQKTDSRLEPWQLWMSDTQAEIMEHAPLFDALATGKRLGGTNERVLVNGLGLGMAVHAALTFPNVGHVDVVEIDGELVDFMRGYFDESKVTFHVGDALTMKWLRGTRWEYAWHDIWPTISVENLPEMTRLHRMYGNRVGWQASWQRDGCRMMRDLGPMGFVDGEVRLADFRARMVGFDSAKHMHEAVQRVDEEANRMAKEKGYESWQEWLMATASIDQSETETNGDAMCAQNATS